MNKFNKKYSKWSAMLQLAIGLLLIILILSSPVSKSASAGDWKPTKTVQILVHTAAAGSVDKDARMMQKLFQEKNLLGVNSVVVNIPGGGGDICYNTLRKYTGDGHYIATGSPNLITNPIVNKTIENAYTNFTQLAVLNVNYPTFGVKVDSPIKTGQDLVDRLKKDPSSINVAGAASRGNHNHIAISMLMKAAGLDISKLKYVIFPGSADAMIAVLGGHLDVGVGPTNVYYPQQEAGKMRIIAVSSPERLKGIGSELPTWKEQGYDVVYGDFRCMMGPSGLSKEQIAFWDNTFSRLANLPEWKKFDKDVFNESIYFDSKGTVKFLAERSANAKEILTGLGMAQ